eukprot:6211125-Pleurochrysis_carterae.AAC.3
MQASAPARRHGTRLPMPGERDVLILATERAALLCAVTQPHALAPVAAFIALTALSIARVGA